MALVPHDHLIETFPAERADDTLRDAVRLRCADRRQQRPNADARGSSHEGLWRSKTPSALWDHKTRIGCLLPDRERSRSSNRAPQGERARSSIRAPQVGRDQGRRPSDHRSDNTVLCLVGSERFRFHPSAVGVWRPMRPVFQPLPPDCKSDAPRTAPLDTCRASHGRMGFWHPTGGARSSIRAPQHPTSAMVRRYSATYDAAKAADAHATVSPAARLLSS